MNDWKKNFDDAWRRMERARDRAYKRLEIELDRIDTQFHKEIDNFVSSGDKDNGVK